MALHLAGSRPSCGGVLIRGPAQTVTQTKVALPSVSRLLAIRRQATIQRPLCSLVTALASRRGTSEVTSLSDERDLPQRTARAALAGTLLSMGASLGMVSAALADAGTDAAGMSAALQNVPAAAQKQAGGFNAFESLLILAPIILYGIFNVYRSQINPKAKLSDFFFIAAGVAVVANLLSILVFRRRFF